MSIAQRQAVVDKLFFLPDVKDAATADLLDPSLTDSNLIAFLEWMQDKGHIVEVTMVRTGHRIDGPLGHNPGGKAVDFWTLNSARQGDWVDASTAEFRRACADAGAFGGLFQFGLAGSAYTTANVEATGLREDFSADPCVFQDEGPDHLHGGVHAA